MKTKRKNRPKTSLAVLLLLAPIVVLIVPFAIAMLFAMVIYGACLTAIVWLVWCTRGIDTLYNGAQLWHGCLNRARSQRSGARNRLGVNTALSRFDYEHEHRRKRLSTSTSTRRSTLFMIAHAYLVVYSNSPNWHDYMVESVIPRLLGRSVVINWSERRHWKWYSLPVAVFHYFGGDREFNPMVVVFRPFTIPRTFRFWRPFRDRKHGNVSSLHNVENRLYSYLDITPVQTSG